MILGRVVAIATSVLLPNCYPAPDFDRRSASQPLQLLGCRSCYRCIPLTGGLIVTTSEKVVLTSLFPSLRRRSPTVVASTVPSRPTSLVFESLRVGPAVTWNVSGDGRSASFEGPNGHQEIQLQPSAAYVHPG